MTLEKNEPKPAMGLLVTPVDASESRMDIMTGDCSMTEETAGKESGGFLFWGGLLSRRRYSLMEGVNTVGREDKRMPSDLQVEDPEMSRRSVLIDASLVDDGSYSFMFHVLKSLNPVKVNGNIIDAGKSIRLNDGDNILMGRTTFHFRIAK